MTEIKKGDKVKIEYVGSLEDGSVFDSTAIHGCPLEFTVGEGMLLAGVECAVLGMRVGDEKEVVVPPTEGYGEYHHDLVKDLPRACFPKDKDLEVGTSYKMTLQNGHQYTVRITKIANDLVTIDLNPPLAGKTLHFKIKVIGIAS
jgi:FKBP-type peptidyl-prolyl cis-trans isomerase 2